MGKHNRIDEILRQAEIDDLKDRVEDESDSTENVLRARFPGLLEATDQIEVDSILPEEAIAEMYHELPERLGQIGLADPGSIEIEDIEILMNQFYDASDVENLYFKLWDEVATEHGPFARVSFEYIMEAAETEDPVELKKEQDNTAFVALSKIGISEDELLDIRCGNDINKRHIRRLAWLVENEQSLDELKKALTRACKSNPETKIGVSDLANHVYLLITNVRDRTRSIDPRNLSKIKQRSRTAELRRLGFIKNLAQSVDEGLS